MHISTDQFSYHGMDGMDGTFTACASTLGDQFKGRSFNLVSQRTDKVVEMLLKCVHHDGEGDLTHWEFFPVGCDAFKNVIIFND